MNVLLVELKLGLMLSKSEPAVEWSDWPELCPHKSKTLKYFQVEYTIIISWFIAHSARWIVGLILLRDSEENNN